MDAYQDQNQVKAMEEELNKIEKNKTQESIPRLVNKNIISINWVFQNKLNHYKKMIIECQE